MPQLPELMNSSNPNFPIRPSEIDGYRALHLNKELPKIRRYRWYARLVLLLAPALAAGLIALDVRNEWSPDLNRYLPIGLGLYALGAILLCGVVGGAFQYAFGGWSEEFEQCRRSHLDGSANLVATRIAEAMGSDDGWNWFRPGNWGDGYFLTVGGCLVLIKFVQGLTNSEIGEITGQSANALRAMQFRALKAMRDNTNKCSKRRNLPLTRRLNSRPRNRPR